MKILNTIKNLYVHEFYYKLCNVVNSTKPLSKRGRKT